uniref:Uncharacterized protein n=1 Tax=viral metagenome TaxID=1070528 RepID=A0A6M3IIA5_9ZZZZ
MQLLQGHFQATAVTQYLCLGAIPYRIEFTGLEGAQPDVVLWDRSMIHDILTIEGTLQVAAGTKTDFGFGEGVAPYEGGDLMTTTNQTNTTYGGGIYVERDDKDYRFYTNSAAGIVGDASTETIDTWTLDTAGTPSGHFNGSVVGTYISKGSIIRIQETASPNRVYDAAITNTPSASGSAANAIYLSRAVPNGKVTFIGGYAGYKPVAIGDLTKPGMRINLASTPFVDGEMIGFMAFMPSG